MKDKDKQRALHADWYQRNKAKESAKSLQRQREIRDTIEAYKLLQGCSICGYNKCARSLHFHHTDPTSKEHVIAKMVRQGRALSSIFVEIEKCVVICANCHGELLEIEDRGSYHSPVD